MIYIVVVNIRHTGKGSGIHFASLGKRILSCNFFGGGLASLIKMSRNVGRVEKGGFFAPFLGAASFVKLYLDLGALERFTEMKC